MKVGLYGNEIQIEDENGLGMIIPQKDLKGFISDIMKLEKEIERHRSLFGGKNGD